MAASQTVRGRVVAEDTGQPLPNARVVVSGTPTAARADLEGRFVIAARPAAKLIVTKAGYVRTEVPVAAATAIRLTRSAAISGRVVNDRGEPVVNANIAFALGAHVTAFPGTFPRRPTAVTDDRGQYRIGGLAPGEYTVAARTTNSEQVSIALPSGGTAFTVGNFTTFYPDTLNAKESEPVMVSAGEERAGVDFHLPVARTNPGAELPMISGLNTIIPGNGDAEIRGMILDTAGRPIPYADVALLASGRGFQMKRTAADGGGAYVFSDVPAGSYRVLAGAPGYSMAADGFLGVGISSSLTMGTGIRVASGGSAAGVDVLLNPWASISGRVVDETGEPVEGALVGLLTLRYQNGRQRLVRAKPQPQYTDDRGEFRIFGVNAGQYVLSASVAESTAFDLPGYGPTYFPGTGVTGAARFINAGSGEALGGIEFPLAAAPTASITGRILDAAGKPLPGGRFNLVSRGLLLARIDGRLDADGTFEFRNVAPGSYVIQYDTGPKGRGVEGTFVAAPVTVGSADLVGLQLQPTGGSRIAGHVTFESSANATPPPAFDTVVISPIPVDFELTPPSIAVGDLNKDGTFEMLGITGTRRLQATTTPPGWSMKAILVDGRAVTDEALTFGRPDQSLADVEVILTDRVNIVTGRVTDNQVRLVPGATVVAFSADPSRWYAGSRFTRTATTTDEGVYTIAGLPTGTFFVTVVAQPPAGDGWWQDPAFLDSIRATATSVTLGDGQAQAVNLRVR